MGREKKEYSAAAHRRGAGKEKTWEKGASTPMEGRKITNLLNPKIQERWGEQEVQGSRLKKKKKDVRKKSSL